MRRGCHLFYYVHNTSKSSAFTLIEVIVGIILLGIVVSAGNYALQPVVQATKRNRQTLKMHRLENEIRRSIFYISNSTPGAPLEIKLADSDIVLGRQGVLTYLNENMTESSPTLTPDSAFQTRIDIAQTSPGSDDWRLLYQIEPLDKKLQIPVVGLSAWPASVDTYVQNNFANDNSLIRVPSEIALSRPQSCASGIMRGIHKVNGEYKALCWNFVQGNSNPGWAIPTSYSLDETTSSITVNYTQLNKVECPSMSIQTNDGVIRNFPSFYAFSVVDMRDFFPPRSVGSVLSTQCQRVIDFNPNNLAGAIIPESGGKCPDKKLYTLGGGSCTPNFDLNSVPTQRSAIVVSSP